MSGKRLNPFATTKNKYFDNYAGTLPAGANQSLNTPTYTATGAAGASSGLTAQNSLSGNAQGMHPAGQGQKLATQKVPSSELERLQREREELVQTGCYNEDDPLI
mgnify:CR=1 FL=1